MAKNLVTTLESFEEVDHALFEMAQQKAYIQEQEAKLNEEQQRLRNDCDRMTEKARARSAQLEQNIESFCRLHKEDFEKTRSKDLTHGSVGFRTNPNKVSLLNRKYNWKTVIELLKKLRLGKFIRQTEEPDKEAILTAYATEDVTDERLAAVGLKIDKSETFNIDIKWDSIKD